MKKNIKKYLSIFVISIIISLIIIEIFSINIIFPLITSFVLIVFFKIAITKRLVFGLLLIFNLIFLYKFSLSLYDFINIAINLHFEETGILYNFYEYINEIVEKGTISDFPQLLIILGTLIFSLIIFFILLYLFVRTFFLKKIN